MKLSALLLAATLAANVVLGTVYLLRSRSDAGSTAADAEATAVESQRQNAAAIAKARDEKLLMATTTAEFEQLRARLTEAGFPPDLVRAIIGERISEQFSARRRALVPPQPELPFWKTGNAFWNPFDAATRKAMQQLWREQNQVMKDALGENLWGSSEESKYHLRRQYGDLPPAKMEQVQKVVSDYSDLRQEVYELSNSIMLPEDREKLAFIEKEQRADIAKILSPAELEEYELRTSSTANRMRSQLAMFKPTEEEFRAIYQIQRAADLQAEDLAAFGGSPTVFEERRERQKAIDVQVQSVLTPERYQEYKLISDPAYSSVGRVVSRFNLPPQTAMDIVALQKDVATRAASVRSNRELSAEQRNAQLSALAQEANTRAANSLGARAYEAYKETGGQWLQNITPRNRPNPTRQPSTTPKG